MRISLRDPDTASGGRARQIKRFEAKPGLIPGSAAIPSHRPIALTDARSMPFARSFGRCGSRAAFILLQRTTHYYITVDLDLRTGRAWRILALPIPRFYTEQTLFQSIILPFKNRSAI
jgi:hypothetical protein